MFYEKDSTENDKKIEQEFRCRRNYCFTTLSFTSMSFILHFQFCLIRIHKIISSRFFYEKYLTENEKKIQDSIECSQYKLQKICTLPLTNQAQRNHVLRGTSAQ